MLSISSRILSRVSRASIATPLRRGYASEVSDQPGNLLSLSLVLPHIRVFANRHVSLVTVPGASGYMGIGKNHMPVIAELKPGVVTVDEPGKPQEKYFVSGGFAYVHQDKTCEITAVEAFPLDQLDADAVKKGLTQYNHEAATASDPESKAKAQVLCQNIGNNNIRIYTHYYLIQNNTNIHIYKQQF